MKARRSKGLQALLVPAKKLAPGAPPRWEFVLPDIPPSRNEQNVMHWAKLRRIAQNWHWWMRLAVVDIPKSQEFRRVTFVRESHGELDDDNLSGAFKFVRDLLRPERIESGVYGPDTRHPGRAWRKVHAGTGMVLGDAPGEAEFVYKQRRISRSEPPKTVVVIEIPAKDS